MDTEKTKKRLIDAVKVYNKNVDEDLIERAFTFGFRAHTGQLRSNGEHYFTHCVAVADILARKQMDTTSIVTALLHDTLEDTPVTYKDLQKNFGTDVANLVEGVTKLAVFEFKTEQIKQAENFRKLLLAMSEDIRVLLIKLADRLHNVRTLHHVKKITKSLRIANETMDIYVPLAERIGIRDWKEELEDICFKYINPDARVSILKRLEYLSQKHGEEVINKVIKELTTLCRDNHIDVLVNGRRKTPYSIWRKMQKKDVGFEQLSDIMAFRVIVKKPEYCYAVLGLIHGRYRLVPGRFKDYVSVPKPNGYRSLHTGVIGPASQRVEIQVRSEEMHKFAELGVAAHWNYKSEGKEKNAIKEGKSYRWLRELLEILETTSGLDDFLETTKMEMYADQVFVFTPKGDLINLPKKSCAIDFAYAIHSKVGDKTVGVRINGRMVPLKTHLHNGDQVEILTSKNSEPNVSWESMVASGKARSAIRRHLRHKKRDEYIAQGRTLLGKIFKEAGYELTDSNIKTIAKKFCYSDTDAYLASLGDGTRSVQESLHVIHPNASVRAKKKATKAIVSTRAQHDTGKKRTAICGLIKDMAVRFPKCCHAVPGDPIVGIVHTGQGVSVHTFECKELKKYESSSDRWIDISWEGSENSTELFTARIQVTVNTTYGVVSDLTTIIFNNGGNITDLKFTNRSRDFYEIMIDLQIRSTLNLVNIMAALRVSNAVTSVVRL